jgi:uncharacterized membrane protein
VRMSKTHKLVVTGVVTTIATATVLTFTRGDTAPAHDVAALPQATSDAPVVTDATKKPAKPRTTPSPKATDPATRTPKPAATSAATSADKPSAPTSKPPAPTSKPSPSATPTPGQKNLIEVLLGL